MSIDAPASPPPIETWWPYVTLGARHRIIRRPLDPLDRRAREEIEAVTGQTVAADATLTEDDRGFLSMLTASVE
ncbi:hypothetical protein ABCS02_11105 [Microbacterium sp. X-17]|uniref:hypothetical protein n=1 Tax=Microbacterium sp. X-17 TaxID=3144404 RepID=UPI0031F54D02